MSPVERGAQRTSHLVNRESSCHWTIIVDGLHDLFFARVAVGLHQLCTIAVHGFGLVLARRVVQALRRFSITRGIGETRFRNFTDHLNNYAMRMTMSPHVTKKFSPRCNPTPNAVAHRCNPNFPQCHTRPTPAQTSPRCVPICGSSDEQTPHSFQMPNTSHSDPGLGYQNCNSDMPPRNLQLCQHRSHQSMKKKECQTIGLR